MLQVGLCLQLQFYRLPGQRFEQVPFMTLLTQNG